MGSILAIAMVVGIVVALVIFIPKFTGDATFDTCDPEVDTIIAASKILTCPDPNNICTQYKDNAQGVLDDINDGGLLLESRREERCVEEYCPQYYAYFKCKCSACRENFDWEDEFCVNECAWSSEQFCDNYVQCVDLIN